MAIANFNCIGRPDEDFRFLGGLVFFTGDDRFTGAFFLIGVATG